MALYFCVIIRFIKFGKNSTSIIFSILLRMIINKIIIG